VFGDTAAKEMGSDGNSNKKANQQPWASDKTPSPIISGALPTSNNLDPHSIRQDRGCEESPPPYIPPKEPVLCPEQAELVDIIMSGRNVFYTGSAGCGKSTVLKAFTRRLRDSGLRVDIVAPTGISALGVGGSTTFVYAGWNLSSFKQSLDKMRNDAHGKYIRRRLKDTDVLVIDEISMVENFHFERLNAVMQAARSSYEPFGGVQLVVTGDFHQLPPVKPFEFCLQCGQELAANRSQEMYTCKKHGVFHDEDKWAFKSEAWALCDFVYFHLRTIHRQNDETFIKILQKCRVGQPLTGEDTDILMNHPCRTGNATKLYARREEVRRENKIRFDKLLSEKFSYPCLDDFIMNLEHPRLERHTWRAPDGSLSSLKDHRYEACVEFKKGMLVVLLTNLDLGRKLCNGSQGLICGYEEFDPKMLPQVPNKKDLQVPQNPIHGDYAEMREMYIRNFMDRKEVTKKFWPIVRFHNGVVRTIYADCSVYTLGNKEPYSLLTRTQIPLAPAWAISIHKSQSLTLDRVIVDLTRAWEEGQVYVALSRATSLSGLKIEGDPKGLAVGKGGNSEVRKFHRDKFGIGP
jgi:ATP-dependent DNA helicase PIF1